MRIGIFGATGQVGTVMRRLLDERSFAVDELRCFASARSKGARIPWKGGEIVVEDANEADVAGLDVALFSCGKTASLELADKVAATGAVVIDNSSAWRMHPDVPLVVPEVNAAALEDIPRGIVANPNCTTMVAMPVLKPIHDAAGLRRVVVSTYQAVSGAGLKGVAELDEQARKVAEEASALTFDGAAVAFPDPRAFPAPIASNVGPLPGSPAAHASGGEDEGQERRKQTPEILQIPQPRGDPPPLARWVGAGVHRQIPKTANRGRLFVARDPDGFPM